MQQQQPPSAQFGAPPPSVMSPFSISAAAGSHLAEAAFPISSRPPPPVDASAACGGGEASSNFDELALAAGEEGGGPPGNRWPRQETLALLKIRSEMDAAFREATFKGPLWEEVSRKLAELGYKRSAKKCKEKFENVHKYYKRTKDGRAGRQDGKTYRFFSQLEALHNSGGGGATALPAAAPTTISFATAMAGPSSTASIQPLPVSAVAPSAIAMPSRVVHELGSQGISTPAAAGGGSGISFSWNSSSTSESESDDEDTELEGGGSRELGRKRKRGGGGGSRSRRRMMNFFEGLMKQVMERQEAMQQRFLEAIEKREQDRLIREEAWRRQEMARLSLEQELLAQERAMAASRDTAVISYLQKISGQTTPLLPTAPATVAAISIIPLAPDPTQSLPPQPPPPPQPSSKPPPMQTLPKQKPEAGLQQHDALQHRPLPVAIQAVPIASEPAVEGPGSGVLAPSPSSRWPKTEVHALIQMRSGLETRYQEAGPKGPLWEEISAGMKRLGYNRSSKRCKEKWENINKYFKKVKDSNKRRPEDAKTCPYFHQLDALYRRKLHGNGGSAMGAQQQRDEEAANHSTAPPSQQQQPPQPPPPLAEAEGNSSGGNSDAGGGATAAQAQTSNGFFEEGTKKSEDAVKDPMIDYDKMDDEPDSENLDQEDEEDDDDDDDEEDDESSKMQYKIQFQPQNVSSGGGGGGSGGSGGANGSTASTATATAATTAGSFMAMVQ